MPNPKSTPDPIPNPKLTPIPNSIPNPNLNPIQKPKRECIVQRENKRTISPSLPAPGRTIIPYTFMNKKFPCFRPPLFFS